MTAYIREMSAYKRRETGCSASSLAIEKALREA
jgi:hypothetical protein